jgi:hypothetical protein
MQLTNQDGSPMVPKLVTLEEIIAKPSWEQEDIDLLIAYQDSLDDETLERLGIIEIKPKSPSEVEQETAAIKKKPKVALK